MNSQRTLTTSNTKEDNSSLYEISQTEADGQSSAGFTSAHNSQPVNLSGKAKSQRNDQTKVALGNLSSRRELEQQNNPLL